MSLLHRISNHRYEIRFSMLEILGSDYSREQNKTKSYRLGIDGKVTGDVLVGRIFQIEKQVLVDTNMSDCFAIR